MLIRRVPLLWRGGADTLMRRVPLLFMGGIKCYILVTRLLGLYGVADAMEARFVRAEVQGGRSVTSLQAAARAAMSEALSGRRAPGTPLTGNVTKEC